MTLKYIFTYDSRSDLMATFHTKRTPIVKAHYTPRNLCMVAGSFVASSRPNPQS